MTEKRQENLERNKTSDIVQKNFLDFVALFIDKCFFEQWGSFKWRKIIVTLKIFA